jgi:NAD-dependent SIR2 family protein deacetylase
MKMMLCQICEYEFDTHSAEKHKAGGKINQCPDCVNELGLETAVRYAGVQAGDGKGVGCTIVAFESQDDRSKYVRAWRSASGQNVGKSCQIGRGTSSMSGLKFKKIGESGSIGTNHKGKST